jgi:ESCRT-II complex subunit VPS25
VTNTGQLNTILTFYEITEPEIPTEISGLPLPLLRKALAVLVKSGKAQIIESASGDGTGVRFFAR